MTMAERLRDAEVEIRQLRQDVRNAIKERDDARELLRVVTDQYDFWFDRVPFPNAMKLVNQEWIERAKNLLVV
jgi:outer membrane protein TolC